MSDTTVALLLTLGMMAVTAIAAVILVTIGRTESKHDFFDREHRKCPCGKNEFCLYADYLGMCRNENGIFFVRRGQPSNRPSIWFWLGIACSAFALAGAVFNWNPIPNVRFNLFPVVLLALFLCVMLIRLFRKMKS